MTTTRTWTAAQCWPNFTDAMATIGLTAETTDEQIDEIAAREAPEAARALGVETDAEEFAEAIRAFRDECSAEELEDAIRKYGSKKA